MVRARSPGTPPGNHAKARHVRDRRGVLHNMDKTPPPGLNGRLERPQPISKHQSWFEFQENKNKKKKLEFTFTPDLRPPPGYEFVPVGNPRLTARCKDVSRERGAMMFIVSVSSSRTVDTWELDTHLNRIGYHFREGIVEEVREELRDFSPAPETRDFEPEPIPASQEEVNRQADLAILDLFPRIPNIDRQMVIANAFDLSKRYDPSPPIGLAADVPLWRRVSRAVMAHIRHQHTRYDKLLRETSWATARKVIQPLCLDTLLKWRGDEETGRDQLDEILCEVVVISDSEDDADEDESEEESADDDGSASPVDAADSHSAAGVPVPGLKQEATLSNPAARPDEPNHKQLPSSRKSKGKVKKRRKAKKDQRGFGRYQAAMEAAWNQAKERKRLGAEPSAQAVPMGRSTSNRSRLPSRYFRDGYFRDLDAPVNNREVLNYDDPPWETVPQVHHHRQEGRFERPSHADEPRPIVGSRPVHSSGVVVERVKHDDRDLKDHLVRSIEPGSPVSCSFPSPIPGGSNWQGRRDLNVRTVDEKLPQDQILTLSQGNHASQRYTVLSPQEDFYVLPPRSHENRVYAETGFHPQPAVPVGSQSRGLVRTANPSPYSYANHQSGTAIDDGQSLQPRLQRLWIDDRGEALRSRSRPISIDDRGEALRSRSRPILIDDHDDHMRQVVVNSAHRPLDSRPLSAVRSATYTRQPVSDYPDGRISWNEGCSAEQRSIGRSQDFIEIVGVSDNFPKRYEAQSTRVDARDYEVHSVPRQSEFDYVSSAGTRLYEQSPPVQPSRIERVVAMVEEPLHRYPLPSDVRRQESELHMNVQRQERVVGFEYVPTSRDPTRHSFLSPAPQEHRYHSRTASVIRDAHSDREYQPSGQYDTQPATSRHYVREDGVIVLN